MKRNYPPEGFVDRLNEVINKSGLRMIEIRRRVNISDSRLYGYVNGEITPSLMILARLCVVLNTSADYLLFGEEKKCNT